MPTSPVDLGPLVKRTAYMLRRAYNVVHEQGIQAFAKHNLRPQQFGILLYLEHAPSSQQGDVAQALGMKPPNFGVELKPLVKRKLVCRSPDPADGRVQILDLTTAGRDLLRAAKKTDAKLNRSFDRKLGSEGRKRLLKLLLKLAELDR
jgi:DNA-binding MarR family transcriptional regulator